VNGRKLVGSAQARRAGALLQQNSLPLALAHEMKARLFGPAAEDEARVATDLSSTLGRRPGVAEVRDAIISGFEAELAITLEPDGPTCAEATAAQRLRTGIAL
jgi:lipoate-protein ligase A